MAAAANTPRRPSGSGCGFDGIAQGDPDVRAGDGDLHGAIVWNEPEQLAPDGLGDGDLQGRILAAQEPGGDVERLFVEPHGLGLGAVGVGIVGGREEGEAQQLREPVRFQGAVRRDQRQRLSDPVPGLAREGEIGGEIECAAPDRRRS